MIKSSADCPAALIHPSPRPWFIAQSEIDKPVSSSTTVYYAKANSSRRWRC
jgi:hypothetical protein